VYLHTFSNTTVLLSVPLTKLGEEVPAISFP